MENDAVQKKKLEQYNFEGRNFLAEQEIAVTITIDEYRKLVSDNAVADQKIRDGIAKLCDMEKSLKQAQEEVGRLKAENYDLQSRSIEAKTEIEALEETVKALTERHQRLREVRSEGDADVREDIPEI